VPVLDEDAFIGAVVDAMQPERHAQLVSAARAVKARTQLEWAVGLVAAVEERL